MTGIRRPVNHWQAIRSWLPSLFLVALIAAVAMTVIGFNQVDPTDPISPYIVGILIFNTVLILTYGLRFLVRYYATQPSQTFTKKGGLRRRFILRFSFAAMVPAAIVALLLVGNVLRGIDGWFSERVEGAINQAVTIAQTNLNNLILGLDQEFSAISSDLDNAAIGFESDPALFQVYLDRQVQARGLGAAWLIDREGRVRAMSNGGGRFTLPELSDETFDEADAGQIAKILFEEAGLIAGVSRLEAYNTTSYLVALAGLNMQYLSNMRGLEAATLDLQAARQRSSRLYIVFGIGYFQLALLFVILAAYMALEAAQQVSEPISEMAKAAHEVRKGNLDVRVPVPVQRDEVRTLSRSFNAMTRQLLEQRSALFTAKDELSARNNFLETLLSAITVGVIRVDKSGTILSANPSSVDLMGWKSLPYNKPLGKWAPDFTAAVAHTLSTGESRDETIEFIRESEPIYLRILTADDTQGGCIITIDDLTRLVTAQRHYAWRDVARRIAHEIRNPLTPIQLSAERINRRFGKLDIIQADPVFDKCISTILRQVDEMGRLVEAFSAFATLPKPQLEMFDVCAMLESVIFAHSISYPDISFSLQTQARGLQIMGDERLLSQVFNNLLTNAGQAIRMRTDEPEMTHSVGDFEAAVTLTLTVNQDDTNGGMMIDIVDTGPGFPDDNLEELFEPYVTHNPNGTGLGLAITRRAVADHGGWIKLGKTENSPHGARVSVFLPLNKADMDPPTRTVLGNVT